MSALDNVFIRAYSKEPTDVVRPDASPEPAAYQGTAVAAAHTPAANDPSSLPEQMLPQQRWHRHDQPVSEEQVLSHSIPEPNDPPAEPAPRINVDKESEPVKDVEVQVEAAEPTPDVTSSHILIFPPDLGGKAPSVAPPPKFNIAREPVQFGRIDAPHAAAPPAPHYDADQASTLSMIQFMPPSIELTPMVERATPMKEATVSTQTAETSDKKIIIHHPQSESPRKETLPVETTTASVEPSDAHPLNPAWEVPEILWPPICDQLASGDRPRFAGVVDMLLDAAKAGHKVISVASQNRGEGRTTLILCLARELANSGHRVLVVDADFQNPQIAESLNLRTPHTWNEVIDRDVPLDEAAIQTADGHLTLLPLDTENPPADLTLEDDTLGRMLLGLAASFDIVLVDTEPLSETEPGCIDAVVLVCDCRQSARGQTDRIAHQLKSAGIGVIGVAKNFDTAQPARSAVHS